MWRRVAATAAVSCLLAAPAARASQSLADVIDAVQPKIVKIYGAGGVAGLESYQSGYLISAEGHVLTVFSYVLDTNHISVTLDDGRRFEGKLLGADPQLDLAVLKIEATELPHFKLAEAVPAEPGTRVLAFSNLFGVATGDEDASVMQGMVSALAELDARRGVYKTPYRGSVYVLDAITNNPGAAGGTLTDRRGRLLGMLGKELRSAVNDTWLNYALPIASLRPAVDDILAGKVRPRSASDARSRPQQSLELELLGLVLVPDVLERTPPFVDDLRSGSPAAVAGLRRDDLVLFVNGRLIQSCKDLRDELTYIDRADEVRLTVMRDQQLIEVVLQAPKESP